MGMQPVHGVLAYFLRGAVGDALRCVHNQNPGGGELQELLELVSKHESGRLATTVPRSLYPSAFSKKNRKTLYSTEVLKRDRAATRRAGADSAAADGADMGLAISVKASSQ